MIQQNVRIIRVEPDRLAEYVQRLAFAIPQKQPSGGPLGYSSARVNDSCRPSSEDLPASAVFVPRHPRMRALISK